MRLPEEPGTPWNSATLLPLENCPEVVNRSIDWADEWQYIRLLEVTREVAPELLNVFIDRGLFSENDEILETAEYFRSKQN